MHSAGGVCYRSWDIDSYHCHDTLYSQSALSAGRDACFSYETVTKTPFEEAGYARSDLSALHVPVRASLCSHRRYASRVLRKWFSSELYILNDGIVTLAVSVVIVLPCAFTETCLAWKSGASSHYAPSLSCWHALSMPSWSWARTPPFARARRGLADAHRRYFPRQNHLLCVRMPAVCLHRSRTQRIRHGSAGAVSSPLNSLAHANLVWRSSALFAFGEKTLPNVPSNFPADADIAADTADLFWQSRCSYPALISLSSATPSSDWASAFFSRGNAHRFQKVGR